MNEWLAGDQEPGPLSKNDQARAAHDEEHKQLVHAIEELADEAYIQAVANDRHNNRPWRNLSVFEMKRFRMTIARAAHAANKKGKSLKNYS